MKSRFIRAITSSVISLGHTASHSPMLVQLPKPSALYCRTMLERPLCPLRLALRQQSQMRDFRAREQRRRRIRTRRHAGAATDARRRIHGAIGILLRNQNRIAVRRAARRHADVSARRDDAIERAAIHHQILDHRKRPRAPRLEHQLLAVLEMPHAELAHRGGAAAAHARCR